MALAVVAEAVVVVGVSGAEVVAAEVDVVAAIVVGTAIEDAEVEVEVEVEVDADADAEVNVEDAHPAVERRIATVAARAAVRLAR